MNKNIGRGAAVAVAMACSSAVAADPFALEVTVNDQQAPPQSQSFGFANVETAIEQLDFDRLSQDFGYQGDEEVDAVMNFRGLEGVTLSFDFQSGDLVFTVPGVKLDSSGSNTRTFQGIGQTVQDQRDDAIVRLYRAHGQTWARWVKSSVVARALAWPLWRFLAWRGEQHLLAEMEPRRG